MQKDLIAEVQLLYSKNGDRIFRQNKGAGWYGKFLKPPMSTSAIINPSDVLIRDAKPMRAGMCPGNTDLVGWTTITIEPEHIGKRLAIFTAIECKTDTLPGSPDRKKFVESVRLAGGFTRVITSIKDILSVSGVFNDRQ